MTDGENLMARLASPKELDRVWRPQLFERSDAEQRAELEELQRSGAVLFCHDTIADQLAELLETREPSQEYARNELQQRVVQHLNGVSLLDYGTWVYYPWSRRLVHVLPKHEYRELRSDRNRYLILSEEQKRLRDFTIGVVGLSVGKSTALFLALEGVGGAFRLADFDVLSLSNMNRVQTGVHNIGLDKVVIAAREMSEIDPYLDISIYPGGINEENADHFLTGEGRLDLLIEECDDLFTKVRLRERARELRIPVLMDTAERGLIDIERFDREPGRPLFHGLAGQLQAESLKGLSQKDKVPYVFRIVGNESITERAKATLVEIGETTTSFPAVASGVALGGAVAANVSRRILLDELQRSGRFYVDVNQIIRDGAGVALPRSEPIEAAVSKEAQQIPKAPTLLPTGGALAAHEMRSIVYHGVLAPSGGNCQPWQFVYRDGRLSCWHDVGRSASFLDFEHSATYLTFGAVVENISLAAAQLGRAANVELFPDAGNHRRVCDIEFAVGRPADVFSDLTPQIPKRVTNRRLGAREPLRQQDIATLRRAAESAGAELQLLAAEGELLEVGAILGQGDRVRMLSKVMHQEMMTELRWTREEVERSRDGLDIATLELSPSDVAGMRVISSWPAMKVLGSIGGGRALEKPAKKAIASASAVGLLTVAGLAPASYFRGGRAMQRLWLTATSLGLALQPMTAITYLFARLERGQGEGLMQKEIRALSKLRERYGQLFQVRADRAEVLLFRVARADPPSARSLRRRVEDVLSFE